MNEDHPIEYAKDVCPGEGYATYPFMYPAENGCCYDTLEDVLHIGVFGFCGCVEEDLTTKVILDHLRFLKAKSDHVRGDSTDPFPVPSPEFDTKFYLMEQLLGNLGLTEHGTAIRYSWPTKRGERLLELYGHLFQDEGEKIHRRD